jgi:hypothetical protein
MFPPHVGITRPVRAMLLRHFGNMAPSKEAIFLCGVCCAALPFTEVDLIR